MHTQCWTTITAASGVLALAACAGTQEQMEPAAAPVSAGEVIDLDFINHVAAEVVEQDVFAEKEPGADQVYRVTAAEAGQFADAAVFAAAEAVAHDPMNMEAVGPYPKGQPLGFTLEEWLAGSGSGTYACEDGQGKLRTTFTDLVPNGVYTMWYFIEPDPPTVPYSGYDLPLGARDGSQNTFVADAEGNATYNVTFEPCLQLSSIQFLTGLAIAYHSDENTYGRHPGEFGENSHVQLFTMLPKGSDLTM